MSTLEQAQADLKEADEKIQKLTEDMQKLQSKKSSKYFYKEKKFTKFDGSGSEDIRDWCESIHKYINARFLEESEKIDFIVDHLTGNPKAEIKFRLKFISTAKQASGDVLQILTDVFGDRDRATKLLKTFYSRDQEKGESLEDYSYVLIELMTKMSRIGVKQMYNPEYLLKERFASGVIDVSLRRELQRLNEDQKGLPFHQLREKAIRWIEEDAEVNISKKATECNKQETTDVLDMVTKQQAIIQEQQKQLAQVGETLKAMSTQGTYMPRYSSYSQRPRFQTPGNFQQSRSQQQPRFGTPNSIQQQRFHTPSNNQPRFQNAPYQKSQKQPIICNYCRLPNHFMKDCLALKEKERKSFSVRNSEQEADVAGYQEQEVGSYEMAAQSTESPLNERTS